MTERRLPKGTRHRAAIAAVIVAGLLQGCGDTAASGHRDDPRFTSANATAADRQAAAALSLSGAAPVQGGDPYATTLGCAAAIAVLEDVVRDNSLVGTREREGIQSAGVEYTNRVIRLGAQKNLSRAQTIAEVQQAHATAADDPGSAARNALGCISELARGN